MSEVNYIKLADLIHLNPHNIETIKQQYLFLLSQSKTVESMEIDIFRINVERIHQMGMIVVGIICDFSNNIPFEIIASGTIIIQPKFCKGGKNVARIEDIIVSKHMRGQGISRRIVEILQLYAREKNCIETKNRSK